MIQSTSRFRWLLVTGLILTTSLLTVACNNFGKKLMFKKGELYYTKNVNEADAKKLGDYLVSQDFFTDQKRITVQLDKRTETYLFRLVVLPEYVDKADYIDLWTNMSGVLSRDVFNGSPVEIQFCNDRLESKRTIPAAPAAAPVQ